MSVYAQITVMLMNDDEIIFLIVTFVTFWVHFSKENE